MLQCVTRGWQFVCQQGKKSNSWGWNNVDDYTECAFPRSILIHPIRRIFKDFCCQEQKDFLETFISYIHIIKDRKNDIYTICHFVAENMV